MAVMRIVQRAIVVPWCPRRFSISAQAIHPSRDVMRSMKIHLASWRHSADTGANAYGSKVIGGRFYDARFASGIGFVEL
jgi:hypothetical protein